MGRARVEICPRVERFSPRGAKNARVQHRFFRLLAHTFSRGNRAEATVWGFGVNHDIYANA
jgi:hypothetical protein